MALEVSLQTARMRGQGLPAERLALSNFRHGYWTIAQMIAHQTVNGCNLRAGDLLGSGTMSGVSENEAGSLLELTAGGQRSLLLRSGENRTIQTPKSRSAWALGTLLLMGASYDWPIGRDAA